MKKLIFLMIVALMISCSSSDNTIPIGESSNTTLISKNTGLIQIDNVERPLITSQWTENFEFSTLIWDENKPAELDTLTDKLYLYYDLKESVETGNERVPGICIDWNIAKKTPSRNCDGDCMDCIGFRCGPPEIYICGISVPEPIKSYSKSRDQISYASVDKTKGAIVIVYENNIDWISLGL